MLIREETRSELEAIYAIHITAFPSPAEAELVKRLQLSASPLISLVAEEADTLIGHILFSPVILDADSTLALMGLAPMAVMPDRQKQGIGSALVEAGLKRCAELEIGAVAVLGHPGFYPKFGFTPSTEFAIKSEYDVPSEVFMLKELSEGYLNNASGTIRYHEEFSKL